MGLLPMFPYNAKYSGEGNNRNRDKRRGRWFPNSEVPREIVPNRRKCREGYFPNAERDTLNAKVG